MNENRAGESRQQAAATLSRAAARRGWGALFVLALLALAGNYFSLPLFFGVEFLFGSIFVLLAAHGLGASRGVLVALLAGLYTWLAWHHPYFLMVMLGEAIFVGLLLRRWRNILLLDGVFWVVLGMPLFYFLLRQMLRLDGLEAGVIVLKSAVNGIFNALMASLLIKHFPALAWPGRPRRARLISLRQAAFNIVVGCVLLPVFIFTIVECRRAK